MYWLGACGTAVPREATLNTGPCSRHWLLSGIGQCRCCVQAFSFKLLVLARLTASAIVVAGFSPRRSSLHFPLGKISSWIVSQALDFYVLLSTHSHTHTPTIAFRHLPPNSARFSYATEGALFISAQLSTDAVSTLRKVQVLIMTVEAT